MTKKIKTTFDKWMSDPEIKKLYEEGFQKFVLSELVLAMMSGDNKTVRGLAREMGVSSSVIQKIRSRLQKKICCRCGGEK